MRSAETPILPVQPGGACSKHGIAFNTVQNSRFNSIDDVHLWMIDQHLGRRSVSDFQRGVLALRKKDIMAARVPVQPGEAATAELQSTQSLYPNGAPRYVIRRFFSGRSAARRAGDRGTGTRDHGSREPVPIEYS